MRSTLPGLGLVFLLACALPATCAAETRDKFAEQALPPAGKASEVELKWNFSVGDVIEYQQHIVEHITIGEDQPLKNERDYHCLWTVTEVEPDGVVTIVVRPTLIRIHSEFPPFDFDSRDDDPTVETPRELPVRPYLYEARSMANAEFTMKVMPTGAVVTTWGALPDLVSLPANIFMTSDMPKLPGKRVSTGESWTARIYYENLGSVSNGEAIYRFAGWDRIGDRWVCRIEGDVDIRSGAHGASKIKTVGHFDAKIGLLVDERNTGGSEFVFESGEPSQLQSEMVRQLTRRTQPLDEAVYSGENLFASAQGSPLYLIIGGEKQESKGPRTVQQVMLVSFYRDLDDVNGNKIAEESEVSGLTTQLAEETGIEVLVNASGMQDENVRAELVGSHGEKLGAFYSPILTGSSAFFIWHMSEIDRGVYFLEWYVNDAFLIRTPVQVHSSAPSIFAELIAPIRTEQDTSPITEKSDLVVVSKPQVELRLGKKSLGFCRLGDVFRKVDDENLWVFLQSPAQKGWVQRSDVIPIEDAHVFLSSNVVRNPSDAKALCARGRFAMWISMNLAEADMASSDGEASLLDLAAADFDEALRLDSSEPMAYVGRGMIRSQKGELRHALVDLDVALRLDSSNIMALQQRAAVKMRLKDFDGAMEDMDHATALDSQNAESYDFRGLLHGFLGQWDLGIADCDRAIKLNPKLAKAYHHRGALWHFKGDDDIALRDYDEAIRLGLDDARVGRALILKERGEVE